MKKLILLTYVSFTLVCSAQVDFVTQADLLLNAYRMSDKKQYNKALNLYEEAFAIHTARSAADYVNAAVNAAELKKEASCKKWINAAITKKEASKKLLLRFSKNQFYQDCLTDVLENYTMLSAHFFRAKEHPKVYMEIQKLLNRDQFSRKIGDYHLGVSEEEKEAAFDSLIKLQAPKDSIARKKYETILFPKVSKVNRAYNSKIMRYTDSLNVVKLVEITKEYGWQEEGWLILWHQRGTYGQKNWVWDYFKPLIDKEIRNGRVRPYFWAMFEDSNAIRKTGKSIYGYHPGAVDPKTVNLKRKRIGLPAMTAQEIEKRNAETRGGRTF